MTPMLYVLSFMGIVAVAIAIGGFMSWRDRARMQSELKFVRTERQRLEKETAEKQAEDAKKDEQPEFKTVLDVLREKIRNHEEENELYWALALRGQGGAVRQQAVYGCSALNDLDVAIRAPSGQMVLVRPETNKLRSVKFHGFRQSHATRG